MQYLGNKVSYISDNTNKSNERVVPQSGYPVLDTDIILLQEILDSKHKSFVKNEFHSGLFDIGEIRTYDTPSNLTFSNVFLFKNKYALVNGCLIRLGNGTNQKQGNDTLSIWDQLSTDPDENAILLKSAPTLGGREDLVFLEVWEELIDSSSTIYPNGNTQFSGTSYPNDILHPDSGNIEISKRTQIRFSIRTTEGVDFYSYKQGLGHGAVFAQGPNPSPNFSYIFQPDTLDKGLWVSGNGDQASIDALGTVDGYTYAIPLFRVHRRNKTVYSLTNLNGNSAKLGDVQSDRPDNLYYDGIVLDDIEDLRHLIPSRGIDFESLAEDNLQSLIRGGVSRIVLSSNADIVGKTHIQLDGISSVDRPYIDDKNFRVPNDIQRVFSDSEYQQDETMYVSNASLVTIDSVLNVLNLTTSTPQSRPHPYNNSTIDPWVSSGVTLSDFPKVYNVDSGGLIEIAGDSSFGIQGWKSLDDRAHLKTLQFKPANPANVAGKNIIIKYKLMWPRSLGFSYPFNEMLHITNDISGKDIIFTNKNSTTEIYNLKDLRSSVGGNSDSAIKGSIQYFVNNNKNEYETYRGGIAEVTYYDNGNGTNNYTTPTSVYGQGVIGVFRVFDVTANQDSVISNIQLQTDNTYKIFFTDVQQTTTVLKFTFLLSGAKVDYEGATKAITETAQTEIFLFTMPSQVQIDALLGVDGSPVPGIWYSHDPLGPDTLYLNLAKLGSGLKEAVAAMGFYRKSGTSDILYHQVFSSESGSYILRSDIEISGFNTPFLKLVFNSASGASSDFNKNIKIPLLGFKAFSSSDQFTLTYNYKPYSGLTREIATTSTFKSKVLYVSPKTLVTSSGTGFKSIFTAPQDLKAITANLPLNSIDRDCDFSGEDIEFPYLTNKVGSSKFVISRDYATDSNNAESYKLLAGEDLVVQKYANTTPLYTARGGHLNSPAISEGMPYLLNSVTEDVSTQVTGSNRMFIVSKPIVSVNNTLVENITSTLPLANVSILVTVSGVTATVEEVFGADKKVVLSVAPALGAIVTITYNTAASHMNVMYGICHGLTEFKNNNTQKVFYEDELLLFTITTTSDTRHITNTTTADTHKVGTGKEVLFNNNKEIITNPVNQANRILGAVDFFRLSNKPLIKT